MIPVVLQDEPIDFDKDVRQKGLLRLKEKGIDPKKPPPEKFDFGDYWSKYNVELHTAYSGVCAYLAIYFDFPMGSTTDHFIAKSKLAGCAYNWDNYRLSCAGANWHKNKFDDVLDPFGLIPETFVLNFLSGAIEVNPQKFKSPEEAEYVKTAKTTIVRLKLDSPEHQKMRTNHFNEYLKFIQNGTDEGLAKSYLKGKSPFVWYEAQRQGLL